MRMHHPGANNREQPATDQNSSKSIVTLALPMYTVGIGVFFVYTCCKVYLKYLTNKYFILNHLVLVKNFL